ncbi:MAG: ABC transporter permease [Gemmatimonadaceae bacterium]
MVQQPHPPPIDLAHPPPSQDASRASIVSDLREILRDLVHYRELLRELTMRDLRIRYKQAAMGVAWAVLTPLIVVLAGWVLRVAFSYAAGGPVSRAELGGVALKSLGWAFFVGALGFGTASIPANLPLVTKVYFPRELLPLSTVVTQVVDTAIGAAALVIVLPFFGVGVSVELLWAIPLVVLLIALTTGVVLLASCANVFFRDAKHLVQIVMSFGIFFTPVFFDADAFGPRGLRWLMVNPLAPLLEGIRIAVVEQHNLLEPLTGLGGVTVWSPWMLVYSGTWAILGTAVSAVIFHRAEFRFAEYV